MGVSVDGLSSKNNRALRQAEGGPTARVEPVRDVLDAVLLFDLHVAGVGPGKVCGGDPGNVVAIQEQRHSYLINPSGAKPVADTTGAGLFRQVGSGLPARFGRE